MTMTVVLGLASRTGRKLGDATFEASMAIGMRYPQNVAIEEALRVAELVFEAPDNASIAPVELPERTDTAVVTKPPSHGLTPREVDVLVLVASGLTNRQIATQVYLSVGTIERHLVNLYRKIGVRRRTEATAFAIGHGLVARR